MVRLLVLLLVLGGCSAGDLQPRLDRELQTVWWGVFAETHVPPKIVFRADLNCKWEVDARLPGGGGYVGFTDLEFPGKCMGGVYHAQGDVAWVAMPVDSWYLHETSLSHEQLHAHLWRTYLDVDVNHTRPEWQTLWPTAQQKMTEEGE